MVLEQQLRYSLVMAYLLLLANNDHVFSMSYPYPSLP